MRSSREKGTLPWYLNPNAPGDPESQANVQAETGGDIRTFKLNHTMVHDETLREIETVLQQRRYGIEYVKMHSGDYVDRKRDLPAFVRLCRKYDTIPYVGGGATESALRENTMLSYVKELERADIDTIEISNSYGDLPATETTRAIASLRKDFKRVLVEIGAKTSSCYKHEADWHQDLDAALNANADCIILEGTGSGSSGIYNDFKEPNSLLVGGLVKRAGKESDRFLIEAPYENQRAYWMAEMFGWNVRLGNIPLDQECLARTEEMRVSAMAPNLMTMIEQHRQAHRLFYDEIFSACTELKIPTDRVIFHHDMQNLRGNNIIKSPHWRQDLRQYLRQIRSRPRILNIEQFLDIFFGDNYS